VAFRAKQEKSNADKIDMHFDHKSIRSAFGRLVEFC
jgi:hypothetical protein